MGANKPGVCEDCRWWDGRRRHPETANMHTCRRFPPHAQRGGTWWPVTSPNQWCGEWQESREDAL